MLDCPTIYWTCKLGTSIPTNSQQTSFSFSFPYGLMADIVENRVRGTANFSAHEDDGDAPTIQSDVFIYSDSETKEKKSFK
jgi:hypothetical protein